MIVDRWSRGTQHGPVACGRWITTEIDSRIDATLKLAAGRLRRNFTYLRTSARTAGIRRLAATCMLPELRSLQKKRNKNYLWLHFNCWHSLHIFSRSKKKTNKKVNATQKITEKTLFKTITVNAEVSVFEYKISNKINYRENVTRENCLWNCDIKRIGWMRSSFCPIFIASTPRY